MRIYRFDRRSLTSCCIVFFLSFSFLFVYFSFLITKKEKWQRTLVKIDWNISLFIIRIHAFILCFPHTIQYAIAIAAGQYLRFAFVQPQSSWLRAWFYIAMVLRELVKRYIAWCVCLCKNLYKSTVIDECSKTYDHPSLVKYLNFAIYFCNLYAWYNRAGFAGCKEVFVVSFRQNGAWNRWDERWSKRS